MSRRSRRRKHRKSKQHPKTRADLAQAKQFLQQGNLPAASTVATQAYHIARNQPERESAAVVLAEIRFREAVKHPDPLQKLNALTEALKAAPKDPRLHFHRGIALLQAGQPAEALQELTTVAKSEPDREGLAFFQELASAAAKKAPQGSNSCSRADLNTLKVVQEAQKRPSKKSAESVPEEPLLGSPHMWSALLRLRHDKSANGFPALKDLPSVPPSSRAASTLEYYQGVAAMRADAAETAGTCWQQAISHGFSESWVQKNLGIFMRNDYVELAQNGDWQKLATLAHKAPADLNDDVLNQIFSLAFFHVGYEQARKNQWAQALKSWNAAAKWAPNRYLAQNIALAHERLNQWEQAADAWRDMLKRRPRKAGHADYLTDKQVAAIWAHAAECYVNDWCDNEAVKCFRKAIDYDPQNVALRFKLVTTHLDKEYWNPDAAIRELNAILAIQPDNIDALTQLAQLYEKTWRHNAMPVWKKIIQVEPDNAEARQKLVDHYLDRVFPEDTGLWYYGKKLSYKEKLAILDEALELIPDEPELIVSRGIVHLKAKKKPLAREQFLRAYELAPQKPGIAALVVQNLIHIDAADEVERILPEIRTIPDVPPNFWVEQGREAFDHPQWARRFFDEALEQARSSQQVSVASVLVDICLSIIEEGGDKHLQTHYLDKIHKEAPNSGALEYIDAFSGFQQTGDTGRARRLLRKSKKLAKAANDPVLLRMIEAAEQLLSPSSPFNMLNKMLGGMGGGDMFEEEDEMFNENMLNDFLNKMKGFF